ncbi:MAG: hypothetical protein WAK17_16255 [Candidatus Nitrosopolaris sp.]|jgi:hypothetical protein
MINKMNDYNQEIPPNATIRQEYVRCDNPDCQKSHGPCLYAYWKEDKKLNKKYVGKNLEDFGFRKIAKEIKLKPSQYIKFRFIQEEAHKGTLGNPIGFVKVLHLVTITFLIQVHVVVSVVLYDEGSCFPNHLNEFTYPV